MVALYITGLTGGSGKTAICAGIGAHLAARGGKVGFFRPVMRDGASGDGAPSDDEALSGDGGVMKAVLSLGDAVDDISPTLDAYADADGLRRAFDRISGGKEIVIIEDDEGAQPTDGVARALDARVLIVDDSAADSPSDRLTAAQKLFGERLIGVVLNKVPPAQLDRVRSLAPAAFSQAGIPLLAVLPDDRRLFTMTIGQLAETVRGHILNNPERSAELAENFMLGAMCIDSGRDYFDRKQDKVAVLKGERPDLQMAALETPTRCLVLSGGRSPLPQVLYQAEDKQVPIIQANDDVPTIVASIETALAGTRFSAEKLPRIVELMEARFDFRALDRGLGIDRRD